MSGKDYGSVRAASAGATRISNRVTGGIFHVVYWIFVLFNGRVPPIIRDNNVSCYRGNYGTCRREEKDEMVMVIG